MGNTYLHTPERTFPRPMLAIPGCTKAGHERMWFAVYTSPNSEKSLVRHLDAREIESFLPSREIAHTWKNRQRVTIVQPLFPSYLFVRIQTRERSKVLQSPGALRIVGNCQGPLSVSDQEIDFLRSDSYRRRVEPFGDLLVGKKVRIKSGPMQGVQGTLVEKRNSMRFVLTIELINQSAAVEVTGEEIEVVP